MKLKMKQIAILIAGLGASTVSLAAPVTPAQIDAARSNGTLQQAWMTGASAPTLTVYAGWVRGCDLDTNTIFAGSSSATRPGGSTGLYAAYACTRGGVVSVLYHTMDGGSLNAYTPHTVGSVLGRLKYVGTANGCNESIVKYVDELNAANNADVYRDCALIGVGLSSKGATPEQNATNSAALLTDPNAPQWPAGGLSDVEAALFPTSIGGGLEVSKVGTENDIGVGQVFTVVASVPLYRAMQAAQGITTADPDFDPANAPNITSAQYAGIASTGGAKNWSSILPGNTNEVILARRFDTSGTQASSDAFFLRNPCNAGVAQQLAKRTAADSEPGVIEVVENSGSSGVSGGVTTASNATDPKKTFSIGVLSAETNWRLQNPQRNGFRVLKLDGVHPELGDTANARLTAANGNYKFHMELKSFVRADYAGKAPKTAFEARIIDEVSEALKNPSAATCSKLSRGLTLNPINGSDCTVGVEVARMTNNGKNCAMPIQFF